mmetsp:Transcript_16791/g.38795  ORF Transcript_16791/g.38795 Transcript_16791/m.38795 type:complete len:200 (-) Transcript_16791:54-653(-)
MMYSSPLPVSMAESRPGWGVARKPCATTSASKGKTPSGATRASFGQTVRGGPGGASGSLSVSTSAELTAAASKLASSSTKIRATRSGARGMGMGGAPGGPLPGGGNLTEKKLVITRASPPPSNSSKERKAGLKSTGMIPRLVRPKHRFRRRRYAAMAPKSPPKRERTFAISRLARSADVRCSNNRSVVSFRCKAGSQPV